MLNLVYESIPTNLVEIPPETISKIPDPEKVKKTVRELRALCRQFDLLNFQLDEVTAYVDAEICKSPLTAYRLGKTPEFKIDRDSRSH
jgi:hypothetical protein